MKNIWKSLSTHNKLLSVVGLMTAMMIFQLSILFYAINMLVSVRTLIYAEGIWSKAQKNAVQNLYHYAQLKNSALLDDFSNQILIIDGFAIARTELNKKSKDIDNEIIRSGLRQGQIKESDIEGVIKILKNYKEFSYIQNALQSLQYGDNLIKELKFLSNQIKSNIYNKIGRAHV